jgi:hypothetical protein
VGAPGADARGGGEGHRSTSTISARAGGDGRARARSRPFLELFHTQVLQAFSNRDTRGLDEKTIKLLLMTYASLGRAFYPLSEKEFAQGYGDLFLGASRDVAGTKYLLAARAEVPEGGRQARADRGGLRRGRGAGRALRQRPGPACRSCSARGQLKAGMLVFIGAKKVLFRPWEGELAGRKARKPATRKRARAS